MTCRVEKGFCKSASTAGRDYAAIAVSGPVRVAPVNTQEQAEKYLAILSALAGEAQAIEADVEAACERMRTAARSIRVEITGEAGGTREAKLIDYLAQIEEALRDYGLNTMPQETIENGLGRIARRKSPDRMAFIARHSDEATMKPVVDEPTEKDGEKASIAAVMKLAGKGLRAVLSGLGLDRFWKIEIKPDLNAAKKSLADGLCTANELKKQGMELIPGEDRVDLSTSGGDLKRIHKFFDA